MEMKTTLSENEAAALFKALGDPTRLKIFAYLRSCGGDALAIDDNSGEVRPVKGATVGEVCCSVTGENRITSTVSHHLRELRIAGLVDVERQGKNMICRLNPNALALLIAYLGENSPNDACAASKTDC